MTPHSDVVLFAFESSRPFGGQLAASLGIDLSPMEERSYEDGEHKTRALVNVRGRDVYVIQSLYSDSRQSVNDKLVKLLFFIASLRDAAAGRIAAVVPYLAYARKDRKTKSRDPITTRYVAQQFEAAGTDTVLTIDVHNLAAFQNAFRIRTEHLEASRLLADHVTHNMEHGERVCVVSPDAGGVKRAQAFRDALALSLGRDVGFGLMEKTRSGGELSAGQLYGDVANHDVIIVDDMISTGGTLALAAQAAKDLGANRVRAIATHGIFLEGADCVLRGSGLDHVVTTDTVPPFRLEPNLVGSKVTQVTVTGLFAEAIQRLHDDESVVDLIGR